MLIYFQLHNAKASVHRCISHGGVGLTTCGGAGRHSQAHLKCGTISPPCGTAEQRCFLWDSEGGFNGVLLLVNKIVNHN